jgi:hypothetical protein
MRKFNNIFGDTILGANEIYRYREEYSSTKYIIIEYQRV